MARRKKYGEFAGAASGAAVGAAAGSAVPGVGTAAGAGIGMVIGGLGGGLFDGGDEPWYDEGWFRDRENAINDFSLSLAGARARYLASIGNMYNRAYSNFVPAAEAHFAGRGLSVTGGAYQSALAREAANYQSQLEPLAMAAEREDLSRVESLRDRLFSQKVSAKSGAVNRMYETDVEGSKALGSFGMNLILQGLSNTRDHRTFATVPGKGRPVSPFGGYEDPADMFAALPPPRPKKNLDWIY